MKTTMDDALSKINGLNIPDHRKAKMVKLYKFYYNQIANNSEEKWKAWTRKAMAPLVDLSPDTISSYTNQFIHLGILDRDKHRQGTYWIPEKDNKDGPDLAPIEDSGSLTYQLLSMRDLLIGKFDELILRIARNELNLAVVNQKLGIQIPVKSPISDSTSFPVEPVKAESSLMPELEQVRSAFIEEGQLSIIDQARFAVVERLNIAKFLHKGMRVTPDNDRIAEQMSLFSTTTKVFNAGRPLLVKNFKEDQMDLAILSAAAVVKTRALMDTPDDTDPSVGYAHLRNPRIMNLTSEELDIYNICLLEIEELDVTKFQLHYQSYLDSVWWKKLSKAIKEKHSFCQYKEEGDEVPSCNRITTLQVHHPTGEYKYFNEDMEELIVLCDDHHSLYLQRAAKEKQEHHEQLELENGHSDEDSPEI